MNLTQLIGIDPVLDDRESDTLNKNNFLTAEKNEAFHVQGQSAHAQRLESLGALAGGIAHDLNNVLLPILMSVKSIKKQQPQNYSDIADLINDIESNVERGVDLIRQVLTFSRGVDTESADIDLKLAIDDLLKLFKSSIPTNIVIDVSIPPDLWAIRNERSQLLQVLMNLCVNARDAMPGGGVLTLRAANALLQEGDIRLKGQYVAGKYVEVSIADTGTGIPEAIRDRIFDPFFTTKDASKGTGLGLSVVHSILKKQGGFINLRTQLGQGSQFTIYFPTTQTLQRAIQTPKIAQQDGAKKVLVVDDDDAVRNFIEKTLVRAGFSVVMASNGSEALNLVQNQKALFDIVVTDINMPVMDGVEAISEIRKIAPKMPIVAFSGRFDAYIRSQISKDVPLLSKPFTFDALLGSMKSARAHVGGQS